LPGPGGHAAKEQEAPEMGEWDLALGVGRESSAGYQVRLHRNGERGLSSATGSYLEESLPSRHTWQC
jgi:hypothetical protein